MPVDHFLMDFLTFIGGASVAEAFHFLAFLVDGPALDLAVAVPDGSALGARAEIGIAWIGDSDTSLKPGT
jgi:hypothetical protein